MLIARFKAIIVSPLHHFVFRIKNTQYGLLQKNTVFSVNDDPSDFFHFLNCDSLITTVQTSHR